jgi:hypothetical protein
MAPAAVATVFGWIGEPGRARRTRGWSARRSESHVAHVEIAQEAAAVHVGLQADRGVERVGRPVLVFEHQVLRIDVLDAAGHLAAQRDGAVAAVHDAVLDHDVLRRAVLRVEVLAGLDGDAVVAGVEGAAFDQHVVAGFRIEAVAVRAQAVGVHLRMTILRQWTGWCCQNGVGDLVALQQHVGAADHLDHRRAQVVAEAEHALRRSARRLRTAPAGIARRRATCSPSPWISRRFFFRQCRRDRPPATSGSADSGVLRQLARRRSWATCPGPPS